jgi:hypothetical protein
MVAPPAAVSGSASPAPVPRVSAPVVRVAARLWPPAVLGTSIPGFLRAPLARGHLTVVHVAN